MLARTGFALLKRPLLLSKRFIHSSFSVAQYNILAKNMATEKLFPYSKALEWSTRKHLVIQNLAVLNQQKLPDIFCLQELTDYWTFFKDELASRGFGSVYVKRPSIAKSDGTGIFYDNKLFSLVDERSMTYSDEYGKVALFVLLKNRHTNRHLMVCSTHLYWDRNRSDVQLQELHQLHATFCRLKIYWDAKIGEDIPSIICGDFNNTPKSKVYSFMTSEFGKPLLQFRSAFDTYAATTSMHTASPERTPFPGAQVHGPEYEPPFTTITHKRAIPVDFIWYSTNQLQVKALSQIPTEEELRAEEGPTGWKTKYFGTEDKVPEGNFNGIPNSQWASDHLPILAKFCLLE